MKDFEYFDKYIATVPNFPKEGIIFKDITPSAENPEVFRNVIDAMAEIMSKYEFDKILCPDARGFIFGSPLGYNMNKGIVLARKPGKLPRAKLSYSYDLEYGKNTLYISEDALKEGERVIIIDDLLATGGSAGALIKLAQMSKAVPVAAVFYVGLPSLKGEQFLKNLEPNIDVKCIVEYPDLD